MNRSPTVAALFVEAGGVYCDLEGVDVWGEERDARTYGGPFSVVAHPPCGRWCQLASVNEARWGAKVGDDGGCFEAALSAVRTFGGVLEHPAYSLAWAHFGLPYPARGGWQGGLMDAGYATEIDQAAYGVRARKRTWLYAVGCELPGLRWEQARGELVVGAGIHSGQAAGRGRLDGAEASRTPPALRDVLLEMARSAASYAALC